MFRFNMRLPIDPSRSEYLSNIQDLSPPLGSDESATMLPAIVSTISRDDYPRQELCHTGNRQLCQQLRPFQRKKPPTTQKTLDAIYIPVYPATACRQDPLAQLGHQPDYSWQPPWMLCGHFINTLRSTTTTRMPSLLCPPTWHFSSCSCGKL